MEIEKPIIKTYSRRQPITRFRSRAVLVPSYTDRAHVRESRLNDKTLLVENFDDTFDRLASGVVIPSPENSLDENGDVKRKDSDNFGVFKVPLQAEKPKTTRKRGKAKKKGLVSVASAGVKRKKVQVDSNDSDSSDQEEQRKKLVVGAENEKLKDKGKITVERKKHLSPVKVLTNDEHIVSDNAAENVSNNSDNNEKENIETDNNFKKPKEISKANQLTILNYFKASTPKISRTQINMDTVNTSPTVMEKEIEKDNEPALGLSVPEIQIDHMASSSARDNASENAESSTNDNVRTEYNSMKPKHMTKVDQLRHCSNSFTSTPRVNKIRMPMDLENLSPILSSDEKRTSRELNDTPPILETEEQPNDENCTRGLVLKVDDRVPLEKVGLSVKSPIKLSEILHDEEDDCSKINGDIERSEMPPVQENADSSQSNEEDLFASIETNKINIQDKTNNPADGLEPPNDDQNNLLVPALNDVSYSEHTLNKTPPINKDLHKTEKTFAQSPLLFDDSECNQSRVVKNNVISQNEKEDAIQINFSQNLAEKVEEKNKESATSDGAHVEPAINKNKNFDVTTESTFYPHEWSNDYDSTYSYDRHEKNSENDKISDSKLDENEEKNHTDVGEPNDETSVGNVTEVHEASDIDNTEIQFVNSQEQEKTQSTICHENSNAVEQSSKQFDEQEENATQVNEQGENVTQVDEQEESMILVDVPNSSDGDDDKDSMDAEQDNFYYQTTAEEENPHCKIGNESFVDEQDESIMEPDDRQSFMSSERPSKRRKTDTSELMIYDKVENGDESLQNEEEAFSNSKEVITERISVPNIDDETVSTESANDENPVKPANQNEEIVEKLQRRELKIILSRIDNQIEEYKSPILSHRKPVKRKSVKRLSRKSVHIDDEFVLKKKKFELSATKKSKPVRVTRRSVTEDRIKKLYAQFQCKELKVLAMRLEDQIIVHQPRRSLKRQSREYSITEENEVDSSLTNGGLSEFLAKFNDPMKVTMRRKTQKKFERPLAAIDEDQLGHNTGEMIGKKKRTIQLNEKRVTFNESERNSLIIQDIDRKSQPIFLKPGKSWARSLSIINHFHNGKNLDELAAGRENWRHSVQTVLNMQTEVSARNSSQSHGSSQRESRSSRVSQRGSKSLRKSSILTSPGRYSRFSMRIIPGDKRSTLTDDPMDSQRISYVSDRLRVSRKTSLKIRRDTLIETEDDLIKSAKDIILKRCKQTTYEPFEVCFPDSYIDNCRKIGEGVYGEVFLFEDGSEKSVIKIIPIEGDQLVNCEPQKKFHEILSEIIIAEELHKLRFDNEFNTNGFVEVNRIMCVIGKYPEKLIDLWYAYDEQKKSENDCPSMFKEDQLYIILELAHGGQDLEAYTFQNASESYAIFLQTAFTLAVAEQSLEFEHRDLHWGNILISKTNDKHSSYKLGSEEISLPTKGVKVAVIDFTLSRMSYQGCKIFNDLAADPTLFEAQGEYQFDIYRMMRDNVDNDWQQFNPFTNVLWMDYTLEKMISAVRYKKKTTKVHKNTIEDMKALRKEIMNYSSAFEFVTSCKKIQSLFNST